MSSLQVLEDRLNQIPNRLLSEEFMQGRGLGNEIGFYVFDYPAAHELVVRARIGVIEEELKRCRPDLNAAHVNLFEFVVAHLEERGLLDKALDMQRKKGDSALKAALAAPLQAGKLAKAFVDKVDPQSKNLVLISGVGSVYPFLRSHTLLNNLHAVMGHTPLVMFYPGAYDGQHLRLFNVFDDEHYYRAFKLVT